MFGMSRVGKKGLDWTVKSWEIRTGRDILGKIVTEELFSSNLELEALRPISHTTSLQIQPQDTPMKPYPSVRIPNHLNPLIFLNRVPQPPFSPPRPSSTTLPLTSLFFDLNPP